MASLEEEEEEEAVLDAILVEEGPEETVWLLPNVFTTCLGGVV